MQLSEDPRFLGQGQAFREEGGWRRGAKGKRDHLGRGGVGQGECQRGAIQSGIQTGGTGGSSAWLARGGHCPDFRRDLVLQQQQQEGLGMAYHGKRFVEFPAAYASPSRTSNL